MGVLTRRGDWADEPGPDEDTRRAAIISETRADALLRAFAEAERKCGLRLPEGAPVLERSRAIVKAAKDAKLDPFLYAVAWFVRRTDQSQNQISDGRQNDH